MTLVEWMLEVRREAEMAESVRRGGKPRPPTKAERAELVRFARDEGIWRNG